MMTRVTGIVLPAEVGTNELPLVAGVLLFHSLCLRFLLSSFTGNP
jgi:hypothetical protein